MAPTATMTSTHSHQSHLSPAFPGQEPRSRRRVKAEERPDRKKRWTTKVKTGCATCRSDDVRSHVEYSKLLLTLVSPPVVPDASSAMRASPCAVDASFLNANAADTWTSQHPSTQPPTLAARRRHRVGRLPRCRAVAWAQSTTKPAASSSKCSTASVPRQSFKSDASLICNFG